MDTGLKPTATLFADPIEKPASKSAKGLLATLTGEDKTTKKQKAKPKNPMCTSLAWNALGKKLFAGFSDGNIRVWQV